MFTLTGDIVKKITGLQDARSKLIADLHTEICPLYGIDTADIFHEFFANLLHESHCFERLTEGMNYQAVALRRLFSRERISLDDCYRYGRTMKQKANQVVIANIIYGGEWGKRNLGNLWGGDGWKFRGSGPIQITGRANVAKFTEYYNKRFKTKYIPEQMAELLRDDLRMGIHSACWIFAVAKQLIDEAISDNMSAVVKKINGGFIGLPDRIKYYELCKKYIS